MSLLDNGTQSFKLPSLDCTVAFLCLQTQEFVLEVLQSKSEGSARQVAWGCVLSASPWPDCGRLAQRRGWRPESCARP